MLIKIVLAIAIIAVYFMLYDLGHTRGHRKGFKEGLQTFEQLHKEMLAAEVSAQAARLREEAYKEGYDAGIKSVDDIIDEADRAISDFVGDDDICEVATATPLTGSRPEQDGNFDEDTEYMFTGGQIIGPLAEIGAEKSECDCKRCVFAETPYCEKCCFIALAGGGESKPSHYQEADEISPEQDCAANIKAMIDKWEVIPLRLVNWYNAVARRKP